MNKSDLLNEFWKAALDKMKEKHCHLIELDHVFNNINKFSSLRQKKNKAILDATSVNPVNLHG
jgi:hypothetical protein